MRGTCRRRRERGPRSTASRLAASALTLRRLGLDLDPDDGAVELKKSLGGTSGQVSGVRSNGQPSQNQIIHLGICRLEMVHARVLAVDGRLGKGAVGPRIADLHRGFIGGLPCDGKSGRRI